MFKKNEYGFLSLDVNEMFKNLGFTTITTDVEVVSKDKHLPYVYKKNTTGWAIELEVPRWKKEQLDVDVKEGDALYIFGKTDKGSVRLGSFGLSKDMDLDKITAKLEDGVLYVTIPLKKI